MTIALIVINILLLALVVPLTVNVLRVKFNKRQRGLWRPWPVRRIPVEQLDDVFVPGPFGPTLDTQVNFLAKGPITVPGGTTDFEAWILAVLAKRSRLMFEFGTCTGKTSYLWALNSPPDGRVVTITLPAEGRDAYARDAEDDPRASDIALEESRFSQFVYSGTDAARKITQLYGDSKAFDETPYVGKCDLVFVDGSHAYSYVMSDSRKALRMVRPGGFIFWHDYGGPLWQRDVFRALNELSKTLPLVHIAGTHLVAYRAPAAAAPAATETAA